jgi:glyoxylase-like metal-dependent hydrolase (beta-lactamase superfamily II)
MPSSSRLDYVDQRRLGTATISVISDGTLRFAPRFAVPETDWRAAMPDADAQGRLLLGLNVLLVQLGAATVLIDPGCDDPGSRWDAGFRSHFEDVERTPGFAAGLNSLGVAPDDITHVLITHAHSDHLGGLLVERDGALAVRFPNARHYLGRADWENPARRAAPSSDLVQRVGPITQLGLLELVDAPRDIAPGVSMLPAPGETPGHCVVRIESDGQRCYYIGDLAHHAAEVAHPDWLFPGRDAAAMQASRAWVYADAADSDALVVTSHELFPAWGRVERAGAGFRWARA